MAEQKLNVSVLFQLKDRLSSQFSNMTRQFAGFQKQMTATGTQMKAIGRNMTTKLSLPIAGLGALSVRTAVRFDDSMRKVKAIITDEGGVTSHAAIVSRELNIPCIIGTKSATQALKDGDMVEIDMERGNIKIVYKNNE